MKIAEKQSIIASSATMKNDQTDVCNLSLIKAYFSFQVLFAIMTKWLVLQDLFQFCLIQRQEYLLKYQKDLEIDNPSHRISWI